LLDFLHGTPPDILQQYFSSMQPPIMLSVQWDSADKARVAALKKAIDDMPDGDRERVVSDIDRVCALADDVGQEALFSATVYKTIIRELPTPYARGLWQLVHALDEFDHAEQIRFADNQRTARMWTSYRGDANCVVATGGAQVADFVRSISEQNDNRPATVEVYHRSRARLGAPDAELVQATIYREGRSGQRKTFVKGHLDRVLDRPVIETAITYEPASGIIEVISAGQDDRDVLVRLFADHMLSSPFSGERIAVRRYRLDHLKSRFAFPREAQDDIEDVTVRLLRLMPMDTGAERLTLECMRGAKRDIWDAADMRFGERNPLLGGHVVTKVRLSVKFRSMPGRKGPRTLTVTITMPQGCDLKERTERERLIGQKYLKSWGLVQDV